MATNQALRSGATRVASLQSPQLGDGPDHQSAESRTGLSDHKDIQPHNYVFSLSGSRSLHFKDCQVTAVAVTESSPLPSPEWKITRAFLFTIIYYFVKLPLLGYHLTHEEEI